jgi:tetratricopeptide (TPR) repeat protein
VDRREAAVNALKEATRLAPNAPEIWTNLAASELALRRERDAEASARRALAVDATFAGAWHNLAFALSAQGRVLEALDAASRALGLVPSNPAFAGHKAQLELAVGKADAAQATLSGALARAPTNAALRFELAGALEQHHELAAAADAYAQVLRIDPNYGAALSQLLFVRQRLADGATFPPSSRASRTASTPACRCCHRSCCCRSRRRALCSVAVRKPGPPH